MDRSTTVETGKLTVKEYLGTGKIAKLFGVAPRTVVKWIDKELLHGTRIPGSKHRRVSLDEVHRFADEHNIPLVGEGDQPEFQEDVLLPEPVPENPPAFDPQPAFESEDDEAEVVGAGVTADLIGRKEV